MTHCFMALILESMVSCFPFIIWTLLRIFFTSSEDSLTSSCRPADTWTSESRDRGLPQTGLDRSRVTLQRLGTYVSDFAFDVFQQTFFSPDEERMLELCVVSLRFQQTSLLDVDHLTEPVCTQGRTQNRTGSVTRGTAVLLSVRLFSSNTGLSD